MTTDCNLHPHITNTALWEPGRTGTVVQLTQLKLSHQKNNSKPAGACLVFVRWLRQPQTLQSLTVKPWSRMPQRYLTISHWFWTSVPTANRMLMRWCVRPEHLLYPCSLGKSLTYTIWIRILSHVDSQIVVPESRIEIRREGKVANTLPSGGGNRGCNTLRSQLRGRERAKALHRPFVPTPSLSSALTRSQLVSAVYFALMLYWHVAQWGVIKSSDSDDTGPHPAPSNGGWYFMSKK